MKKNPLVLALSLTLASSFAVAGHVPGHVTRSQSSAFLKQEAAATEAVSRASQERGVVKSSEIISVTPQKVVVPASDVPVIVKDPTNTDTRVIVAPRDEAVVVDVNKATPGTTSIVNVSEPWATPVEVVSPTSYVPVYFNLTPTQNLRLVEVRADGFDKVLLTKRYVQGEDVTEFVTLPFNLTANETAQFKSGHYTLLLNGYKTPIRSGMVIPMTLVMEDAAGVRSSVNVNVPVR